MKNQQHSIRFVNPLNLPHPVGYSHVVEVSNGKTIFISGQVALDRSGNLVGPNDLRAQTQQIFTNLKVALETVGANFDHVVKLNYYLLDIANIQIVRDIRDQFVNVQHPPASSAVEVRSLVRDDFLIEVDAIAFLPD